jgi:hypothetical protein
MDFVDLMGVRFPDLAEVEQYGTSTEGRPLNIIKIGNKNSSMDKPAFFIDGGMHAREWIGPATVTWFIRELLENSELYQDILDGLDIYITPIANPDGYAYTRLQRLWRKTRKDHDSILGCMGADPNRSVYKRIMILYFVHLNICNFCRNFEVEWGGPGTSADKCSDIYKGPAAWSEPETMAIKEFVERKQFEGVNWVSYFSIHSYAQMWLGTYAIYQKHVKTKL